jgi:phosphatidylglycerophosphatase A
MVLAVIIILWTNSKKPPEKPGRIFLGNAENDRQSDDRKKDSRIDELTLWIAQGFDVGRVPFAPGTFGSLVGLLWFAILLAPRSLTFFLIGLFVGLALSVFFCGEAERILRQTDPGSVVIDEIAAIPVCFIPWVLRECAQLHAMPAVETFLTGRALLVTAVVFVLFRVFDVLKPWPVRQSQALPGGLGVTVDDLLAAAYVALITLFFV